MAKQSGGTRQRRDGGLKVGDANFKGKVGMPQSLSAIKNREVYKEVMSAVSRTHSVLGITQKKVKLANLPDGVGGVHVTRGGKSEGAYLSKAIFQPAEATTQSVAGWSKDGYASGHLTKTNKPVAHIVTHELAHSIWNDHLTGQKYVTAGKDIKTLYNQWKRDAKKKGYGKYASTNVSEFFAEVAAKAVHGQHDKYTQKIKEIIQAHRL